MKKNKAKSKLKVSQINGLIKLIFNNQCTKD
jgi:hypothetical protein